MKQYFFNEAIDDMEYEYNASIIESNVVEAAMEKLIRLTRIAEAVALRIFPKARMTGIRVFRTFIAQKRAFIFSIPKD